MALAGQITCVELREVLFRQVRRRGWLILRVVIASGFGGSRLDVDHRSIATPLLPNDENGLAPIDYGECQKHEFGK
jgi:hypothetical protein